MLASSCAACVSLLVMALTSVEKEPLGGFGSCSEALLLALLFSDVVEDRAGRMAEIWPLVLRTAPFVRSIMSHALTPGFLDSRCRDSSIDSVLIAG